MSNEVFGRLARIVADTFGIDSGTVTPEMTAEDVPNWDSLNHLRLISAVEAHFGIRFTMAEVMGFQNVGDLLAVVERKSEAA
ncbi:MAG TPA: acyl carrier protein [Longimicrobiales bacterium]|nr:acyl carrier protein [Longimicrobiales bacterium]